MEVMNIVDKMERIWEYKNDDYRPRQIFIMGFTK